LSATISSPRELVVRPIRPADAGDAARIVHAAFAGIHDHHRFARDFPTPGAAAGLVGAFVAHPGIWGVVAERNGRVVGSNFLDERGEVRGVGPITVDPDAQERGVGGIVPAGHSVRALTVEDLPAAAELSLRVHGYERTADLADALGAGGATAVLRDGKLAGYATSLAHFASAHAVAETTDAMSALVLAGDAPASFLLPTRQHELFRRALSAGLRVVKPMNYMVTGHHREPAGAWIPSVLY
jgi:hypothetical protein